MREILAYDESGRLAAVHARFGDGPGEIPSFPLEIAAGSNGEVYVVDASLHVNVFAGLFGFRRRIEGLSRPYSMIVLGDSLIASQARAMDSAVLLYDAINGTPQGRVGREADERSPISALAVASQRDHVWIGRRGAQIELWDLTQADAPIRKFVLNADPDAAAASKPAARIRPITPNHIWQDPDNGHLWIVHYHATAEVASQLAEFQQGAPLPVGSSSPAGLNRAYDTLILVLDVDAGSPIAEISLDEYVYQFLEDGRAVTMGEMDDGYQWIELLSLRLDPK